RRSPGSAQTGSGVLCGPRSHSRGRTPMRRFALLAALLLGFAAPAAAAYPERALTIGVAYPAGGMSDIAARPMAESMKKTFTKGVAVLNRPGGGGSVGMAEVAQAKPDGYTVILAP